MTIKSDTLIQTLDGTSTLYSAEFNENMHSLSGAYEEALLKHVIPSGLLKSDSSRIEVLDIGFGLGYNTLALLTQLKEKQYSGTVSVTALEKDQTLISYMDTILFNDGRDDIYTLLKKACRNETIRDGSPYITIMFGDARKSVLALAGTCFDAVFFDPFSPSRNPELWTVEFLKEVFRLMSGSGILTTYSSALQIRAALIEAGFIIGRGPSVGGKREGTLAAKTGVIAPLTRDDLDDLQNNIRAIPYHDNTLSDDRALIRDRRRDDMKKLRAQRKGTGIR